MSLTIIGIIAAVFISLVIFFICLVCFKKKGQDHYMDLQTVTLTELPANIYFTVLDSDRGAYIIDILKYLPGNGFEPTEELLRLTGEKDLSTRSAYQVYETMLNGKRRYLIKADSKESTAA